MALDARRKHEPLVPTVRLFRQAQRGDWNSVFGEMKAKLTKLVA
jgi:hypothetical protein